MKGLVFVFAAFFAVSFSACGNKTTNNSETATTAEKTVVTETANHACKSHCDSTAHACKANCDSTKQACKANCDSTKHACKAKCDSTKACKTKDCKSNKCKSNC